MEGYYEFCITKYVFEGIIDIQDVSLSVHNFLRIWWWQVLCCWEKVHVCLDWLMPS